MSVRDSGEREAVPVSPHPGRPAAGPPPGCIHHMCGSNLFTDLPPPLDRELLEGCNQALLKFENVRVLT